MFEFFEDEEETAAVAEVADGPKKFTHEEIIKEIMPKLKEFYFEDKKGEKLRKVLIDLFEKSENALILGLDLTEKAGDYLQPRSNSLSGTIFKEFHDWYRQKIQNDEEEKRKYSNFLNFDLQFRAFDVCTRRHTHLLWMATEMFRLRDVGERFIDEIRGKCRGGFYKEAIICVTVLKLQPYFGLNEIAIPCILQDKTNLAEPYLVGFSELQRELLEILDQLCSPDADIGEFLNKYKVSGVRKDKLSVKPLQKLIARIAKQYNIPPEITPNLTKNRSEGTLRYLLHRRYVEQIMETANFDDMVQQAVETCPHLAAYLLTVLCDQHNDFDEAAKWAKTFRVAVEEWPEALKRFVADRPETMTDDYRNRFANDEEKSSTSDEDFLTIPLSDDDILVVDDEAKLKLALGSIETSDVIGLDTEWQPIFGQAIEKVAIVQIATKDKVFLLDLVNLPKSVNEDVLKSFMERMFCNEKILKLGFQFGGDMKTLTLTMPYCREIFYEMRNTLCIGSLIDALKHEDLNFMNEFSSAAALTEADTSFDDDEDLQENETTNGDNEEKKSTKTKTSKPHCGLSEVCFYFLGKPLKKSEQFSNWSRRPLRNDQVRYAALDAHCLIEIYERVKRRAAELNLNFDKTFNRSLISGSKIDSKQKTKKSTSTRNMERAELAQIIEKLNETLKQRNQDVIRTPKDFKVVVDNMLQGLGKHLRRVGVDCIILENFHNREICIDLARKENRLALSCGSAFAQISSRLPPSMSCCVPNMINSKEQLAWFLDKFNVAVSENDIFSRCMICNGAEFLILPKELFRISFDALVAPYDFLTPVPFDAQAARKRVKIYCSESMESPSQDFIPEWKMDENSFNFRSNGCCFEMLTGKLFDDDKPNRNIDVQVDTVPSVTAFENISVFYICRKCGKVYWDGAHMRRYVNKVGIVVNKN